jgi:hypothetical protein
MAGDMPSGNGGQSRMLELSLGACRRPPQYRVSRRGIPRGEVLGGAGQRGDRDCVSGGGAGKSLKERLYRSVIPCGDG